jgi:hypothetical protein
MAGAQLRERSSNLNGGTATGQANPGGGSEANPEGQSEANPEGQSEANPEGRSEANRQSQRELQPTAALVSVLRVNHTGDEL